MRRIRSWATSTSAGSRTRCPTAGRCWTRSSFRVGEGSTTALIGANGAGKTTLLRIIRGDEPAHGGAVSIGGALGVMDQFVGHGMPRGRDDRARPADRGRAAAASAPPRSSSKPPRPRSSRTTTSRRSCGTRPRSPTTRMPAATSTRRSGTSAPWPRSACRSRARGSASSTSLSGGEQKRLVLEALLRGPDDVLLLDEPDNYLDVPGKRWLEKQLRATPKTVLLVSHDRELLARGADRIVTLETGAAGSTAWVHGGGFATYHQARDRPHGPARRAAPALGRAARQDQGARRRAQGQGDRERRVRVALSGRPDAAREVRGGRPARRAPARAGPRSCGCAAPAPASAPSSPSASSSPGS